MLKKILIGLGVIVGILFVLSLAFSALNNRMGGLPRKGMMEDYGDAKNDLSIGAVNNFSAPMMSGSGRSQKSVTKESDIIDSSVPTAVTDKKVIKNGNLTLKVDKAEAVAEKISQIAKANNGEVFASNFYQSGNNSKSGTMTVKVPFANFEKTLGEIKKVASLVVRESVSGQDVTEEYADLQAQLKNKQAEEQSFVRILDQSGKIDDILAVTREVSRVRGEIEQLQGRIKYLNSQTDMSTITVSLSEDPEITVIDSWRPWIVIKDSAKGLIKSIQEFVDFVIVLIIQILPLLILYAALIFGIFLLGRKIYRRVKSSPKPE